ncbi:MAG TPA: hypothetical protein VMZ74_05900, partial [Ramlibacter sp.]|nr:hypothetical protein [Ramlibacter sp.]
VETRNARIRNLAADRAVSRKDYPEVHRLFDVDVADWRRDLANTAANEAGLAVLHSLAWHAQGEPVRAIQSARKALAGFEAIMRGQPDLEAWFDIAQCHAVLGNRSACNSAFDKNLASTAAGGNLWALELSRRSRVYLDALLGDDGVVSELARQSRLPGFFIHDHRVRLELAHLWDRPEFLALVADPVSNAPLPLDTPVSGPPR